MANNCMFLRCKVCGDGAFIGKTYLDGWGIWPEPDALHASLSSLFDEHQFCGEPDPGTGHRNFEIAYEHGDPEQDWSKIQKPNR